MKIRFRFLLLALSIALLYFSFHKINIWPFAWVALVPFFFAVSSLNKPKAFFFGYLTGLIFNLFTLGWLIHVTMIGWIALCLYSAIYFALFALIFSWIEKYFDYKPIACTLAIASFWVILEFFQGFIILGGFGWTLLGYTQYQNLPIIQVADIFGVFGISFLMVLVNLTLWRIFLKRKEFRLIALVTTLVAASVVYGFYCLGKAYDTDSMKIAVVQGNIPLSRYGPDPNPYTVLNKYLTLSYEVLKNPLDLLIWPETPVGGSILENDADILEAVVKLTTNYKTPLLLGTIVKRDKLVELNGKAYLEENYYNSAALISKTGKILDYYKKTHLVPFGEYVPGAEFMPFLRSLAPIGDFSRGEDLLVFDQLKKKFSVLICFEDVFPNLSKGFTKNGAQFLVNITNDAWFKDTSAAYQHLSNSVLRAVENRRPVVRAANTGISAFIDSNGRILSRVTYQGKDLCVAGYKTFDLPVSEKEMLTIYHRFGNIFVILCLIFLFNIVILKIIHKEA